MFNKGGGVLEKRSERSQVLENLNSVMISIPTQNDYIIACWISFPTNVYILHGLFPFDLDFRSNAYMGNI